MRYTGPELKVGVEYEFVTEENWGNHLDRFIYHVLFCEENGKVRFYFQSKLHDGFIKTSVIRKDASSCLFACFSGCKRRRYYINNIECFFESDKH